MTTVLDLAGIGAGPFNLAVAALLHRQPLQNRFFEARPEFAWHPGLMLPNARLQTSHLKDLVTPVDPTNPYSFLNYLVKKGRFYEFMNAEQENVSRQEFADYLGWVARQLPNLSMDSPVESVEDAGDFFRLQVRGETVLARNLCVATGKKPHIPRCAETLLSDKCFHALDIGHRQVDLRGLRVAVIGGGQTGAEIVENILADHWGRVDQLHWVSRRSNYLPLDETPFTNDWFTPQYVDAFRKLPAAKREQVVGEQKLASDGISPSTLKSLYQQLYRLKCSPEGADRVALLPNRELQAMNQQQHFGLTLLNQFTDEEEFLEVDCVILCTGLEESLPACLTPLEGALDRDEHDHLRFCGAFANHWENNNGRRLYILGAGRYNHGIAEPQLSLSSWRAACVVNDVCGQMIYETQLQPNSLQWRSPLLAEAAVAEAAVA